MGDKAIAPRAHMFNVPLGNDLCDVTAQWILQSAGADPLAISNNILLLPNNRAIKAMTEAFVRQAYLRLLGRGADAEGLHGYVQQLQHGVSRSEAYQALAASEEAQRYETRRQQMRSRVAVSTPMVRHTALMPAPVSRAMTASGSSRVAISTSTASTPSSASRTAPPT